MALTGRQLRAYKHLCDIVRADVAIASGVPGAETYTLLTAGVPCHYEYSSNISSPTEAAGRMNRDMIFTTDKIHFESSTVIDDTYMIINRSLLPGGSRHPNWGEVHRIQGYPQTIASSTGRKPNKLSVMAMVVEQPPPAILTLVGS